MKHSHKIGINDIASDLKVNEIFDWLGDVLKVTYRTNDFICAVKIKKDGTVGKLKTEWLNHRGYGFKNYNTTQSFYHRY